MYGLLLAVIYLAFVSLGLPDSLLGAGWPVIHTEIGVPISYAGAVSMITSCGTVVTALFTDRLVRRFGASIVTALSVLLSALSLFGFSVASSFGLLCLLAVPYGLAAGAVDAVLNNYVALHYSGRHMSWLHCFWGVGAAVSPYIMGYAISGGAGWHSGYLWVAAAQAVIAACVFASLPLWKKGQTDTEDTDAKSVGFAQILSICGVKPLLLSFFCYCALETTAGMWASTFLAEWRNVEEATAANFASLFYLGITAGRFVCGFLTERIGDKRMVRIGSVIVLAGMCAVALPVQSNVPALAGLLVIGLGCAPIYPCIVHSTPYSFGKAYSQSIIGMEMSAAYAGSCLMPPLFGLLAEHISMSLYPFFLLFFGTCMLLLTERKNRMCRESCL